MNRLLDRFALSLGPRRPAVLALLAAATVVLAGLVLFSAISPERYLAAGDWVQAQIGWPAWPSARLVVPLMITVVLIRMLLDAAQDRRRVLLGADERV